MSNNPIAERANMDERLTRAEAAAYLKVAPQTLACWACNGKNGIPYYRVGKAAWYRKADLDAFMAARLAATSSQHNRIRREVATAPAQ